MELSNRIGSLTNGSLIHETYYAITHESIKSNFSIITNKSTWNWFRVFSFCYWFFWTCNIHAFDINWQWPCVDFIINKGDTLLIPVKSMVSIKPNFEANDFNIKYPKSIHWSKCLAIKSNLTIKSEDATVPINRLMRVWKRFAFWFVCIEMIYRKAYGIAKLLFF